MPKVCAHGAQRGRGMADGMHSPRGTWSPGMQVTQQQHSTRHTQPPPPHGKRLHKLYSAHACPHTLALVAFACKSGARTHTHTHTHIHTTHTHTHTHTHTTGRKIGRQEYVTPQSQQVVEDGFGGAMMNVNIPLALKVRCVRSFHGLKVCIGLALGCCPSIAQMHLCNCTLHAEHEPTSGHVNWLTAGLKVCT